MENIIVNTGKDSLQKHMLKCFVWMFVGLCVTALTSYLLISTNAYIYILLAVYDSGIGMGLVMLVPLFLQLGLVFYLSSRLEKMSVTKARVVFVIYSAITGLNFSFLPAMYGIDNMFLAFGFTAVLFGCMAAIGSTMKLDLTKYSTLIIGALVTLVIVSVIGLFLQVETLDMMICYGGLFLFLVITAYDIQKIKKNYSYAQENSETLEKLSIYGALELYLDFINIFIYILRIMGRKNN